MRVITLIILFMGLFPFVRGQENKSVNKGTYVQSTIVNGDTIPHIELKEVPILPPKKFKSKAEERQYWRLVYNLKKVYPYSKVVAQTVREVDAKLADIRTDKERRKFIKSMEDALWKKYEGDMRQMTITQGKLLFKLIDRETSQSTYFWIDSYRGSVSAFFWQGMARLFGTNLKSEYDPKGDDKLIEQIVTYIEKGLI